MTDMAELAESQIEAAARALAILQLRESHGHDAWGSLLSAVKLNELNRVMEASGNKLREQAACALWAGEQQGMESLHDRISEVVNKLEFYKGVAGFLIRQLGGEVLIKADDLSSLGSIMWRDETDKEGNAVIQMRSVLQESQATN